MGSLPLLPISSPPLPRPVSPLSSPPLPPPVSPLSSPPLSPYSTPESTSPIEEPKTLTEQELNALRETVHHIINTHTPEEATRIFMELGFCTCGCGEPKNKGKGPETGDNVRKGSSTP